MTFLYARAYGDWDAGRVEQVDVPDGEALAAEVAGDAGLREQLDELRGCVGEAADPAAKAVLRATAEAVGPDVLAQWEGFARFCRHVLAVEPTVLAAAFRLPLGDPAAEVGAAWPEVDADEGGASDQATAWTRSWERRLGR